MSAIACLLQSRWNSSKIRRKVLAVKGGLFTMLMLAVLSAAQKTSSHPIPKFRWGQGEPQELDKSLADYNEITAEDRLTIIYAFARAYKHYPNPPSPRERAEQTRVKFVDLNGDNVPEMIAQPTGNICGAANCPLYVFQKIGTNYRVILKKGAAQTISILKTRTNGYVDVVVGMHGSATEESLYVYEFSEGRYQQTHCSTASFTEVNGEIHKIETARIRPCE